MGDLKLTNKGSGIFEQLHQKRSPCDERAAITLISKPNDHRRAPSQRQECQSGAYETENHRHDGCSANALAAIQITERQARNMDDVQSLGVIYINHNMATEHEAEQALSQMSDAQGRNTFSLS